MRHLCGNGIRQSQAAIWWDIVVRVNAAKPGKTTRGHYLGMIVLLGIWIGEWHLVMADIILNIGTLEDSVLAILRVCVCAPKCVSKFVAYIFCL